MTLLTCHLLILMWDLTTMVGFGFKFSFLATSENNKRHKQHKASIYKPQSKSCNCWVLSFNLKMCLSFQHDVYISYPLVIFDQYLITCVTLCPRTNQQQK